MPEEEGAELAEEAGLRLEVGRSLESAVVAQFGVGEGSCTQVDPSRPPPWGSCSCLGTRR
jgi:hypothetical protein